MALAEGQVQLVRTSGSLLMGENTRFDLQDAFNPFLRQVRTIQGGPRPYAHGSWVGAEWQAEAVVPIRAIINGANQDVASARAAILDMSAAFSAVGATGEIDELRFRLQEDPDEFVMFGRPRGFEPDLSTVGMGHAYASAVFVAHDPRIYSGALTTITTGLPVQHGGLVLPAKVTGATHVHGLALPTTIPGVLGGGSATLTNAGTTASGLTVRISGPAVEPWLLLRRPDGTVQSVRFDLTLLAGQWLDIDSTTRQALLNGLPESNQRGRAVWDLDPFPILPGTNILRFGAAVYEPTAELQVSFRSAWL